MFVITDNIMKHPVFGLRSGFWLIANV